MSSTRSRSELGETLPRRVARAAVIPAAAIMLIFFFAPLLVFLKYSLQAPSQSGFALPEFSTESFEKFFSTPYYVDALVRTLLVGVGATLITLVAAIPTAYMITKASPRYKSWLIIGAVFPMLVGSVIRSIPWMILLGSTGIVNSMLMGLGIISDPLQLLQSPVTVAVAIASVVLPVMILILQASMEQVDPATERAALSLGARPTRVFFEITLPQIVPGIAAGTSLVLVMCLNAYATPVLVGSRRVPMLAPEVYSAITVNNNWPLGAAIALVLLILSMGVVVLVGWILRRQFDSWRRSTR